MLIELRATGGQTVVAPSTHPDGDQYLWHQFGEPARINADALKQIVQKIAICSLIARYWTSEGNRHDLGLPIAGLFVSCEWLEEDAVQLIELAAEAAGHQNPRDRVATVRSTYEKFHNDQHITGIPTLLKYWPQEVVNPLTKWCEGLGLNGTDHSAWTQSRTHNANGAAPKSEEQQEHAEKSQASQEQGSSSNGEVLAREVLKNFLEAAKVDPTAAIQKLLADAQQVAALAFLANRDRGVVEAAYIELRTAGARARDVEALKRAITAERRKQRKFRVVDRDETPELTTVRSVLPDAPVPEDLLIPQNYRVSEDGVSAERAKVGPDGEPSVSVTKVAPAPILIAGRLKDVQDGTESVRLVWKRDNGWRSHTAGRVVVATARQIVELAGQGLPTTSNDAPELVRYLSEFEATNMNLLPRAQVSRQMGWQRSGDKFSFLVGRKLIRPDGEQAAEIDIEALAPEDWSEDFIAFHGHDAGDEQLADGFHAAGSYEGWVKAVALIAQYPRVLLGFYAAFVPVLLSVFDSPNFILDYCGQTSMGKTTILRVAASVWGCPDERAPSAAIGTWDATRVFIERSSSVLYSLPLILDDTKRARNPKVVGQTLYDVASGRGRGRGSPRGMRRAGSWTTLLLSSGEAPAVSYTEDGGTRARVLTLWGAPFGGADEKTAEVVNALNSGIRAHYGHAGPQFVQYVIRHRDQWDQWRSGYQQAHALYLARAGADPVVGRLAAYFAAIDETAFLVHQAFELPWYYPDPVASVWDALTREGAEADRASRALAFVLSWASGHEHEFSGRHIRDQNGQPRIPYSGVAGRWDDSQEWEFIAFYPDRIAAILEEQKFEVEAILRTWRERKWLIIDKDRSGFQGCVRIGRNNPRCVVINRKAFTDADLV